MIATPQNGFWVLPTRNRPHNLFRFLKSQDFSTYVTAVIDQEDWGANLPKYMNLSGSCNFEIVEANCLADKMHAIEKTKKYQEAEWVGFLTDDQIPITPSWDLLTIKHLNGKNFVSGNDEWQPHRMVGAVAFSKKLLDAVGGFYPAEGMKHSFFDDVWEHIGRDAGCWTRLDDVIVHHYHHLNNLAFHDITYKENDSFYEGDKKAFKKWLIERYASTFEKVKDLQNG